jgi:hypothetical protein
MSCAHGIRDWVQELRFPDDVATKSSLVEFTQAELMLVYFAMALFPSHTRSTFATRVMEITRIQLDRPWKQISNMYEGSGL